MLFLLTGCEVFKRLKLNDTHTTYTQAHKRAIFSKPVRQSTPGMVEINEVVCMEPSPDIAKASQRAMDLVVKAADGTNAQLSASTATAVASLVERTATIQLLRDQMFRACESYANGAITATSYSLLMSRNNKAMITLMLGETAAGAFGRSGVALGGKSSAEGSQSIDGFQDSLEDTLALLEPIEKAIVEKQAQVQSKENEIAEENKKEDKSGVANLTAQKIALEKELKVLKEQKNSTLVLAQSKQNQSAKTAAEIISAQGFGSLTHNPSRYAIEALADMQEIYMRDSLADEVISACIVEMGMAAPSYTESAERDLFLHGLGYMKNNDPKKKMAAFDTVKLRRSLLAEYCNNNLFNMVTHAEKNRQTNVGRYYSLQHRKVVQRMTASCDRLETNDQRVKCFEHIGLKLPKAPKENKKDISIFYEYNDIQLLKKTIAKLMPEVDGLHKKLEKAAGLDNHKIPVVKISHLSGLSNVDKKLKEEWVAVLNNSHEYVLDKRYQNAIAADLRSDIPKLEGDDGAMDQAIKHVRKINEKKQKQPDRKLSGEQTKILTAEYDKIEAYLEYFVKKLTEYKALLENIKVSLMKFNVDVKGAPEGSA